jgi:hypothetical protein
MSYEEEDTCMSYEEEDTCMSYEEEDTCMSYEEEDTYLPDSIKKSDAPIEPFCIMHSPLCFFLFFIKAVFLKTQSRRATHP